MARVGILAIQHESNTFLGRETTWDDFRADVVVRGDEVREYFADSPHEVGGFFAGLSEAGMTAVGLFAARATPGGTIASSAARKLIDELRTALEKSVSSLDALLVAPHGAAVSEHHADFDGYWLSLVRSMVGPTMPIVATLDLHANVSAQMIRACHAMIAYHTNPHLDQYQCGMEAATLIAKQLRGRRRLKQCGALLPLAVGIERQNTDESPCRELFALARDLEEQAGMASVSPVLGFPYADVPEMGSSVLAVAEQDREVARQVCRELVEYWWQRREEFTSRGLSIGESLDRAVQLDGPVGLLDMGDNVGGGSPGDGTLIAHEVARRRGPRTLVCLWDPDVARRAHELGVGGRVEQWEVGGKHDTWHGRPLTVSGTVQVLTDGRFREPATTHGGKVDYDMGKTAVLQTDVGLTIVAHSKRTPPFSSGQVTSLGLPIEPFQCVVLKGVQAPIAGYRAVCRAFLRVNTPGVTTADIRQLPYSRIRTLYPLEQPTAGPTWVEGACD